ncbi:MAG: HD domain-containing protein [Armatimonadetes bacterium]|nr:HD domain-containing protein [Armatimonadota bacterium]
MEELLRSLADLPRPGERIYLVGGCVRDLLLGRPTKDLDLVTDGNPRRLAERIARRTGGAPFCLHREMRAYRVVPRSGAPGIPVDVLPLTEPLEEDLLRRDFSINAMALPLQHDQMYYSIIHYRIMCSTCRLIDPAGGLDDLSAGRVRHVRPDVFTADPIRLLRAVRMAAVLGFTIVPETEALARSQAGLLAGAAAERVRDELFLLLGAPGCPESVRRLDEMGMLGVILPELMPLKGLEQNANHHLDAWEHTLEVVRQTERLLVGEELPEDVFEPAHRALSQPITPPRARRELFLFAALLHDVAKPQTRDVTPGGVITFRGHDEAGAAVAAGICRRLRLGGRETKAVARMVAGHLSPGWLSLEEPLDPRQRYRFFREAGDSAVETLILSLADRLAARGPWAAPEQIERHRRFVVEMLRLHFEGAPVARPVVPADGRELMRATGLKPGRELGELLEALEEAVAVGEVRSREEAIAFAERWVGERRS